MMLDATKDIAATAPLVVAALSGVSFVAYKHPTRFPLVFKWLSLAIFAANMTMDAWNTGGSAALRGLLRVKLIDSADLNAAQVAVDAISVGASVFVALWIIWFYLLFLSSFPLWLLSSQPEPQKHP